MASFDIQIVTPNGETVDHSADMVVLPGQDGEIGFLVDHADIVTALREGDVRFYQGDTVKHTVVIKGGFAEMRDNQCLILTEEIVPD